MEGLEWMQGMVYWATKLTTGGILSIANFFRSWRLEGGTTGVWRNEEGASGNYHSPVIPSIQNKPG
eukprot:9117378-Prorocentrum_lima.AAC.1